MQSRLQEESNNKRSHRSTAENAGGDSSASASVPLLLQLSSKPKRSKEENALLVRTTTTPDATSSNVTATPATVVLMMITTVLGDHELQHVFEFLGPVDFSNLALVSKSMESKVEHFHARRLELVWKHHQLKEKVVVGTTTQSSSGSTVSFRRQWQQTLKNPIYNIALPEQASVAGCRALALSPSQEQLAIADLAIEAIPTLQSCGNTTTNTTSNREEEGEVAYKVVVWDMTQKQVVRTIYHPLVPAEHHGNNGNYNLQLFWMIDHSLVTCSPTSIGVWDAATGQRLHWYCRYPTAHNNNHESVVPQAPQPDRMNSFVRKDDTTLLFRAEHSAVHAFHVPTGRVQTNICTATCSVTNPMRDLVVCDPSKLIALHSVESKNHGLLVVDLGELQPQPQHASSSRAQLFRGNYCAIMEQPQQQQQSRSSSILAFRVDGEERTGLTNCFVDVLELSNTNTNTLVRRRTIPFASATTQIMATLDDGRFVAQDLVNDQEIMVVNSWTGEFEMPFHMEETASFFPQCAIVASGRKELLIGLDSVESGSPAVMVFSLLNLHRRK